MQDLDRDIKRTRRLYHRLWLGPLLMFGVVWLVSNAGLNALTSIRLWLEQGSGTLSPFLSGVYLVLGIVLGLGGFAGVLYFFFWMMSPLTQEIRRGAGVLRRILPELAPTPAQEPFSFSSLAKQLGRLSFRDYLFLFLFVLAFCAAFWGVPGAVRRFWPAAPAGWASTAGNLAAIMVGILYVLWELYRVQKRSGGGDFSILKLFFQRMMALALFLAFVFLPVYRVTQWAIRMDVSYTLVILLMGVTLILFMTLYHFLPHRWVRSAFDRADYETAVRRSQWAERWSVFAGIFMNLRGYVLFLAGRYEEAAQALRESIPTARIERSSGGGAGLDNLGCVLTAQKRYDEASKMFEGSIMVSPEQTAAYNDWAQVYLFQGIEPERALGLADRALKNYRASWSGRFLERYQCSVAHSSRAWALAQLGRHAEAAQALEQAFAAADRRFAPEFAGVLYRAGQAELLCGERDKAIEHWRQPRQLDPHGRFGGLAEQALRNLEISG